MAKSGVFERDPATVVRAVELKKEFQKMVRAIVDDDDVNLDAIDRAQQMLLALKELKLKKGAVSMKILNQHCETASGTPAPEEFICPLSKGLMRDPVIVATGQVFLFCFRRDFFLFLFLCCFFFEFVSVWLQLLDSSVNLVFLIMILMSIW